MKWLKKATRRKPDRMDEPEKTVSNMMVTFLISANSLLSGINNGIVFRPAEQGPPLVYILLLKH